MAVETRRLLDPATRGEAVPAAGYVGFARLESGEADWLLDELERSGLRGRGGAGFPAVVKWRAVAANSGPRHVVVNGEEGEPASWKDRYLLRHHPHLVLEGALCAAVAIGAESVWLYVSDPHTAAVLERMLQSIGDRFAPIAIAVSLVPGTYVAGDESSGVSFIGGGRALPFMKPPRPTDRGVKGQPTLVNNVETFAHAALIARHGGDWFREVGTAQSSGTFIACVGGDVSNPAMIEVAYGTPIPEILAHAAVDRSAIHGVLLGGYFSGFMPESMLDQLATDEALRPLGFALGNGTFTVVSKDRCPVTVISDLLAFFARESAGQCGVCINGTRDMMKVAVELREGRGSRADIDRLEHLGRVLMRRGACSMLDAAAMVATRAITHFLPAIEAHLGNSCQSCAGRSLDVRGGYAIDDIEKLLS